MRTSHNSQDNSDYQKKESRKPKTGSRTKSTDTKEYKNSRGGEKKNYSDKKNSRSYGDKKTGRSYDDKKGGEKRSTRKDSAPRSARAPRNDYAPRSPRFEEEFVENPNLIIGRNPVMEAIKSGRTIDKVLMQKDAEGSAKKIASMARERKLQVQYVDKLVLDKLAPGRPHQGVAAYAAAHSYSTIDDILKIAADRGEDPLIVILDGLEDPHNLGAILRSADGAGAHGVIIPSRRAVGLTEVVAKASAGAIEYVPVAKVANLASTIELLKEKGLWIASVDMDGEIYSKASLKGPLALVIGGEGSGVSKLVREKSDFIISMPMKGHVNSLNASNAAAIMLYEVARQRDFK